MCEFSECVRPTSPLLGACGDCLSLLVAPLGEQQDLQLVGRSTFNDACRGALPGGDARHMLLQVLLLGALAVQVIWGLCWVASRTLGTLDQR